MNTLTNETSELVGEKKETDDDVRDTNNIEFSNEHVNSHIMDTGGTLINKEVDLENIECTSLNDKNKGSNKVEDKNDGRRWR